MKPQDNRHSNANKPRLSLAQKMRLLARRHRASERRRTKRESKRSDCLKSRTMRACAIGLTFLAIVAFSSAIQAAGATPTFDGANAAFASGNYRAAIEQYDGILAEKGYSAPVLFNLGNAFYHTGQFGAAILSYERAEVLAPRDTAIAANLRLAREKAGVPTPALNEFQKVVRWPSPNSLAWIGCFALAAVCLAIGLGRFFPRISQAKGIAAVGVLILLIVATAFAVRWPEFDRATIVAANAPARIAPAVAAAELFGLKAGETVATLKTRGHFILVRAADGRSGWVGDKDMGLVFGARF
jgi:tetratricopeptide (TPR) repeat protein